MKDVYDIERDVEYDRDGRLVWSTNDRLAPAPRFAGWKAWWTNVVYGRDPVMRITYRREASA